MPTNSSGNSPNLPPALLPLSDRQERDLRGLSFALGDGEGFRLILVTYDHRDLRDCLIERLRGEQEARHYRLSILDWRTQPHDARLLDALRDHLKSGNDAASAQGPRAVMVIGLETALEYGEREGDGLALLHDANFHREAFAQSVPATVALWLSGMATTALAQHAPDLWHWRIATFHFEKPFDVQTIDQLAPKIESFSILRSQPLGNQRERVAMLQETLCELDIVGTGSATPQMKAQRAGLLSELGIAYAALGERERAASYLQDAEAIYRKLTEADQDMFRPDWAGSLYDLSIILSELGHREEALEKVQQAAEIYEQLVHKHLYALLPAWAGSLDILASCLSDLGLRKEALAKAQKAVEIYELLAVTHSDAFLSERAMSLSNLANRLSAYLQIKA
ncbi:MAG: tetratricopeptide repeat protein [Candidatus Sumerlaeota bacterium]|nr:tetratricopeptide repeat protein [Candidatus Sumerlaeota bacterium]